MRGHAERRSLRDGPARAGAQRPLPAVGERQARTGHHRTWHAPEIQAVAELRLEPPCGLEPAVRRWWRRVRAR